MPLYNIIFPVKEKLSAEEKGVLGTMLNNPEDDYCTVEELHETISEDTIDDLRAALEKLYRKKYLIKLNGNIYAVNKYKARKMRLI